MDRKDTLEILAASTIKTLAKAAKVVLEEVVNWPLRFSQQQKQVKKDWKIDIDQIKVEHEDQEICCSNKVILFSLEKPFVLSKHQI